MYTPEEYNKLRRDYTEDKHELLPEDQAHMDSIRQEMLDVCAKQHKEIK